MSAGHTHKNVEPRMRQFAWAADRKRYLSIARCLINGKIRNCRTQIRRNDPESPAEALERLDRLSKDAKNASSIEKLLGIEGAAAEVYFGRLNYLLKGDHGFSFQNRNRRPPKDPVNAVLSYLYAVLAKDMFVSLLAVGFDPYLGFYHQPRYGRPALALDMMEEFRPMKGFGEAIHYSVFRCDLTPKGRVELVAALTDLIKHDQDRVMIVDLGPSNGGATQRIEFFGIHAKDLDSPRRAIIV